MGPSLGVEVGLSRDEGDLKSLLVRFLGSDHDSLPWAGEVGNAAKMMLIVNMVQGSFMATIAEGLTLAQVTGQSQQTLLDILNQGQLASIFLDQKCQSKLSLTSLLAFFFFLIRAKELGKEGHCHNSLFFRGSLDMKNAPSLYLQVVRVQRRYMGFGCTGWNLVSWVFEGGEKCYMLNSDGACRCFLT